MTKKRTTQKEKPSQKTKLILKAKKKQCQKPTLTIDFKPLKKDTLYNQYKGLPIYPVFNNDKKYYTPTFILKYYGCPQSEGELISLHEKKVAEYTTQVEIGNILVAKPRSKNRYCAVCKDTYDDYYTHIHLEQHRQQIRSSRYSRYINQLCAKFNPNFYRQQKQTIQNELQQLMFKYDHEEHNHISSHTTKNNKYKKQISLSLKKQNSLSSSNINNRTTIILSSD